MPGKADEGARGSPGTVPGTVPGSRAVFVLASWLLCSPAVLTSLVWAGAIIHADSPRDLLMLAPALAWFFLGWMSWAWLRDIRLPRAVPVIGTMLGVGSALALFPLVLFYVWGVPLAFRLVAYHFDRSPRGEP